MPAAAHQGLPSNVDSPAFPVNKPQRRGPGKLHEFTRHPKALAKVRGLKLQACLRFVLEALLLYADREGYSWVQAEALAETTPRSTKRESYALPSVRRALRQLKALGWLEWRVIPAFGRYPSRGKDKKLVWGNGRREYHGGRVWRVNLEKLARVEHGTDLAGWIILDPPGEIPRDPPSDRSLSYGESKLIPPRESSRPSPSAPERHAHAGGHVAPLPPSGALAPPQSARALPPVASVARESSRSVGASGAPRSGDRPSTAPATRERQGGKGEQEAGQRGARGEAPALMSREDLARAREELAVIFRGGGARRRIDP